MKEIKLYTDGACSGNPGKGGTGAILLFGKHRKELSTGYQKTTNNRMEMLAIIEGIQGLKEPCAITVFSDSKYVVESMNKGWVLRWKAMHWKKKKNKDLWLVLLELCEKHKVTFQWVKGHADNPLNNRCDELAVAACRRKKLLRDEGYERVIAEQTVQGDFLAD